MSRSQQRRSSWVCTRQMLTANGVAFWVPRSVKLSAKVLSSIVSRRRSQRCIIHPPSVEVDHTAHESLCSCVARQKIDWRTLVPYTRRLGGRGVAGVAPERGFSTGPYTIETKFGVGRGAAERLPVQGEVSIGFDGAVCFRAGAEKKKSFGAR